MAAQSLDQHDWPSKFLFKSPCGKHKRRYSEEEVFAEGKKYKTRGEFYKNSGRLYQASLKYGIHEEVCAHMEPAGNYVRRYVYKLENEFGEIYYGITCDLSSRMSDHRKDPKLKEPFEMTPLTGLVDLAEAVEMEKRLIKEAREDLFMDCKNTKDGGELGFSRRKWTYEALEKEAKKYKTQSDFKKYSDVACTIAYRRGVHHLIGAHLIKQSAPKGIYKNNPDLIKKVALECKTRTEFDKKYPAAAIESRGLGIHDEVCAHMPSFGIRRTPEQFIEECRKYATKTLLRRGDKALHSKLMKSDNELKQKATAHMIYHWEYLRSIKEFKNQPRTAYIDKLKAQSEQCLST